MQTNAVAVEGASLEFKSISCSAVNGVDSFSFNGGRLHHGWYSDDAVNDGRMMEDSDSEGELASHEANSMPSDDEVTLLCVA